MDTKQVLRDSRAWVRDQLKISVDFWLKHGMDPEHGGVYTCLDRKGEIYSTDKSVWMQGRCGWIFAYLCHVYGPREEWLAASKSCLDFMEAHCFNHEAGGPDVLHRHRGRKTPAPAPVLLLRGLLRHGQRRVLRRHRGQGRLERARWAYNMYWDLSHGGKDPTGLGPKTIPETRSGRAFGLPMIILNVIGVLMRVDPEHRAEYEERAQQCVDEIFTYHVKPDLKCVLENVDVDGTPRLYYTEGRTVNPGHDIEGSWFLLEHAHRTGDQELVRKAAQIFDWAIEAGWDQEYGGLLYFIDCLGKPPEAYEHDMKLWWPHNEILIASMMLYKDTGSRSTWTGSSRPWTTARPTSPTRSTASGTATSAGTACPPCPPPRAPPSRAPSICPLPDPGGSDHRPDPGRGLNTRPPARRPRQQWGRSAAAALLPLFLG